MELSIPAIYGIGESLLYFVDRYGKQSIYDVDFRFYGDADDRLAKSEYISGNSLIRESRDNNNQSKL